MSELNEYVRHQMSARAAVPPGTEFERWLDRTGYEAPEPLQRLMVARTSSTSPTVFLANLRAAVGGWFDRKEVRDEVVTRAAAILLDSDGPDAKGDHYLIRQGDLPGGGRSQRVVGCAMVADGSLLLLVHDSADKANLRFAHGETGNAFTSVVAAGVRRLSVVQFRRLDLSSRIVLVVPEFQRLVRNLVHAQRLLSELADYRALFRAGSAQYDPTVDGEILVTLLLSGLAAGEFAAIVRRTTKGKIARAAAGEYLNSPVLLRESHRVETGESESGSGPLVPVAEFGESLAAIVGCALQQIRARTEIDWVKLANVAAEQGVRTRAPRDRKSGQRLLNETFDCGRSAARNWLTPEFLRSLRTEALPQRISLHPVAASLGDMAEEAGAKWAQRKGKWHYVLSIPFPAPDINCSGRCDIEWHFDLEGNHKLRGWPIPDAHLLELERHLSRPRRKRQPRRARPLAGLGGEGVEVAPGRWIGIRNNGRYYLLEQYFGDGPPPSWRDIQGLNRIGSASAAELNAAVGQAISAAVLKAAENGEMFLAPPSDAGPDPVPAPVLRLQAIDDEIAALQAQRAALIFEEGDHG